MINKLQLIAIAFLISFLVSCDQKQELPNILWITCEDITPMLGCYGDEVATTPTLDKLSKEGTLFTNAYATAPVCSPARSSIITGVYATSLGSQHLRSEITIPDSIIPFPKFLKEKGYYCSNNSKEDYNFSDSTIWDESSKNAHWKNKNENQPFFSVFNIGVTHQSQIFGSDEEFYNKYGKLLTDKERHQPKEIELPPYYLDSETVRKLWARYYDVITIMDRQVADLLEEIEEAGLSENTIIFFYSDHGTGMPRGKRALYDSGIKVPFIVKAPEKYQEKLGIEPNKIDDRLISFVDLAPTILKILDIPIPEYMQGKSFLPLQTEPENDFVFAASDRVDEAYEVSRSLRSKKFKYIRNYYPHLPLIQPNYYTDKSEIMVELNQLKETLNMNEAQHTMWLESRQPEELYDTENDPFEINNLANNVEYEDKLKEMRAAHHEWVKKTYDSGLMTESLMHSMAKGRHFYNLLRDNDVFPIKDILEITSYQLKNNIEKDEMIDFLNHESPLVRYWSLILLENNQKLAQQLKNEVLGLLNDEYDIVRIQASSIALKNYPSKEAYEVILDGLYAQNDQILLFAARTYELNAERAKQIKPEVEAFYRELSKKVEGKWYGYDLYASWSLSQVFMNN